MAKAEAKLGLDAIEAIDALIQLKTNLNDYNKALQQVARQTGDFNTAQQRADQILKSIVTDGKATASVINQIANANVKAAQAAEQFAQSQAKANAASAAAGKPTKFQSALGINTGAAPQPFGDTLGQAGAEKETNRLRAIEANLRSVARGAQQAGNDIKKGAETGAQGAKSLEIGWRSVIKVFGTQFAFRAISSLVGAFTDGIRAARGFEIQLAEIQTISKEFASGSIDQVGAVVSRLSAQFGAPVQDVAKGLYQTLSNQIGDTTESVRFLSDALAFSVATVTSAADSVDLLSGVLNSYNLTAASTTEISDELFKTIELGRVVGTELANTYGRVTNLAAQLGVSTTELNASMSLLTIRGVKASDAMTQLTGVFQKLIQPSKATADRFRELGVASAEVGIQRFGGFVNFLAELTKGKTALSEVADLLGGRIKAIRGTGTLVSNTEQLNSLLKQTADSTGSVRRALDLVNQTDAQKLTRQLAEINSILVNDIGRSAVSFFANFIEGIGGARRAISILIPVIGTLVSTSLLIFLGQAAKGMIALGFAADTAAARASVLKGALSAIAGAGAFLLVQKLFEVTDTAKATTKAIQDLQEAADIEIRLQVADALPGIKEQRAALAEQTKQIQDDLGKRLEAIDAQRRANFQANADITKNLESHVANRTKILQVGVKILQQTIDGLRKQTQDTVTDVNSLVAEIRKNQAERTAGTSSRAVELQVNSLISKSRQVSLLGDPDSQKKSLDLLKEAAKIANDLAGRKDGAKAFFDLSNAEKAKQLEDQIARAALQVGRAQVASNNTRLSAATATLAKEQQLQKSAEGLQKAQLLVAQTTKDLNTEITNATNNSIVFGKQFETDAGKVNLAIQGLIAKFRELADAPGRSPAEVAIKKQGAQQAEVIGNFQRQAAEALKSGNVDLLNEIQKQMLSQLKSLDQQLAARGTGAELADTVFGSSIQTTRDQIKLVADTIDIATKSIQKLQDATNKKTNLDSNIIALKGLADASAAGSPQFIQTLIDFLGVAGTKGVEAGSGIDLIGTSSTSAISGLQGLQIEASTFDTSNIVSQADQAAAALQRLRAAQGAGGAGGQGLAWGGVVRRFAAGGFVPRGTDTVPAMLTPNEFVVNARDSKRFRPQLIAMNSGRAPVFRSEGGSVDVGDINVTVAGGSTSQQSLTEIADGLNRMIRQGRINFRGGKR